MQRGTPWARGLFGLSVTAAVASLLVTLGGREVPVGVIAVIFVCLVIAVAAGVFWMSSGLFARPILGVRADRSAGRLALTFDDGPDPRHTRAVMDLLEERGHRGTFFVIGRRAESQPEMLLEIRRRGHGLGNHTFAHSWMTPAMPVKALVADLARAQAVLAGAGEPPRWFRPPVGILSPRVALAARAAKLELVGWTATARDGVKTESAAAAGRLIRALRPGAILVLHDGSERGDREPIVAAVLGPVLDALDERGLKSVTLDELLGPALG